MPSVSVVVPAYNAERYLEECLTSILAQSFPDLEVILVDDGSTDRTPEIAQTFVPRIRYHRQENQGVAGARNTGIRLAEGEYVSLVDADDALCPRATETQVELFTRYPQAGMVHGGAHLIDELGRSLGRRGSPVGEAVSYAPSRQAVRHLLKRNTVVCSSVMVRKSCFEEPGGFRQEFVPGEDWEMWLRIAAHHDVIYIGRPLARYRSHPASLTAGFTVKSVEASHSKILRSLFSENGLAEHQDWEAYAYASNDRTLARLAGHLRERPAFLRYLGVALRRRPALLLEKETWGTLYVGAKTFVPQPLLHALRNVKNRIRSSHLEKDRVLP